MAEQGLFQNQSGGSIPTSPLQYLIKTIITKIAVKFIKEHHYSHTCPAGTYRFGLYDGIDLIGVAVFGQVIGRFQAQYYYPKNPDKLIELRRLCCIDDTPKNTESRFIGYCLRWLKKNTEYEAVLSLADQNYGHKGIIYQATNFKKVGYDQDKRDRIFIDDIERHPRDLYDKDGSSGVKHLKRIYGDRIMFKKKIPKIVYLYLLNS